MLSLNVERPSKAVVKHLICPLYGGGSGNAHTVTQRPRTPNRGAFVFLKVERMNPNKHRHPNAWERLRQRLTIAESVCKKLRGEFERELSEKLEAHGFIAGQGLREAFAEYQNHARGIENGHWPKSGSADALEAFGANPSAFVVIPSECLIEGVNQVLINAVGDCMDSADSPMRIKHGDKLLIHPIEIIDAAITNAVGRMIVFKNRRGRYFTQHLTFADITEGRLYLSSYNPRKCFAVGLDDIAALFVVDGVFTSEYIEAHKYA